MEPGETWTSLQREERIWALDSEHNSGGRALSWHNTYKLCAMIPGSLPREQFMQGIKRMSSALNVGFPVLFSYTAHCGPQ